MSIFQVHHFVKTFAVLSFLLMGIKYWEVGLLGVTILLSPYVLLYLLSTEQNYRNKKLRIIRITPAIISFIWVAWVLLEVDVGQQTSLLVFNIGLIVQISIIIAAECIITLFKNSENCT